MRTKQIGWSPTATTVVAIVVPPKDAIKEIEVLPCDHIMIIHQVACHEGGKVDKELVVAGGLVLLDLRMTILLGPLH